MKLLLVSINAKQRKAEQYHPTRRALAQQETVGSGPPLAAGQPFFSQNVMSVNETSGVFKCPSTVATGRACLELLQDTSSARYRYLREHELAERGPTAFPRSVVKLFLTPSCHF